jgi:hypothetical protein
MPSIRPPARGPDASWARIRRHKVVEWDAGVRRFRVCTVAWRADKIGKAHAGTPRKRRLPVRPAARQACAPSPVSQSYRLQRLATLIHAQAIETINGSGTALGEIVVMHLAVRAAPPARAVVARRALYIDRPGSELT